MTPSRRYINLGEWVHHRTYGGFDGDSMTLMYFRRSYARRGTASCLERTYKQLSRNMTLEKLLNWITPLTLGALLGLYELLHGLFYVLYGTPDQKRDYPLEIVLGLPIMALCLAGHWVIRRITDYKTRSIWIAESILVVLALYGFYRS